MNRRLSISSRVATILFVVLCTAGTASLRAQYPGLAPMSEGRVPEVAVPGTPLPGPRLAPELRPFEPTFADGRASAQPLLMSGGKDHTFVFSTLVLVLFGVIVVLLVL